MNEQRILDLIETNANHNKRLMISEFLVKPLDFLDMNWSQEITETIESADVILAADGNIWFLNPLNL